MRIIDEGGSCAADNRNTLLDHFPQGQKIILLEDDLYRICRLNINPKTKKRKLIEIKTNEELMRLCERGFGIAQKHRTVAWGTSLCKNCYFMSPGYSVVKICDTGFFGITNTDLRFNNEFLLLDDPDMVARIIKKYGAFIGINDYTAVHARRTSGGCKEMWSTEGNKEKYVRMIMQRHGDIFNCDLSKENSITLKRSRR